MNNNSNKKPANYTVYIATWINWDTKKGSYAYSIVNNGDGSIFYRDYNLCDFLESTSQGEMLALIAALSRIPIDATVLIKTSQSVIAHGINYNLEHWVQNQWLTKEGNAVKYQNDWNKIHGLIQGRKIFALHTQEGEFNTLQNTCKQLVPSRMMWVKFKRNKV